MFFNFKLICFLVMFCSISTVETAQIGAFQTSTGNRLHGSTRYAVGPHTPRFNRRLIPSPNSRTTSVQPAAFFRSLPLLKNRNRKSEPFSVEQPRANEPSALLKSAIHSINRNGIVIQYVPDAFSNQPQQVQLGHVAIANSMTLYDSPENEPRVTFDPNRRLIYALRLNHDRQNGVLMEYPIDARSHRNFGSLVHSRAIQLPWNVASLHDIRVHHDGGYGIYISGYIDGYEDSEFQVYHLNLDPNAVDSSPVLVAGPMPVERNQFTFHLVPLANSFIIWKKTVRVGPHQLFIGDKVFEISGRIEWLYAVNGNLLALFTEIGDDSSLHYVAQINLDATSGEGKQEVLFDLPAADFPKRCPPLYKDQTLYISTETANYNVIRGYDLGNFKLNSNFVIQKDDRLLLF